MTDIEKLLEVAKQDATALVPLADVLEELGHPQAEELTGLAMTVVTSPDWEEATMAAALFLTILEMDPVLLQRMQQGHSIGE